MWDRLGFGVGLTSSPGLRILAYHGLVDSITSPRLHRNFHTITEFETHMRLLKRMKFEVIGIQELIGILNGDSSFSRHKLACITFDDGYRNNLRAIEILRRERMPGIIFLSTGSIGTASSIWTVNLSILLLKGKISRLKFLDTSFDMRTFELRNLAFNAIRNYLKGCDTDLRVKLCEDIESQYNEKELADRMKDCSEFEMLSWDEIRSVQDARISFQSHGHHHELHNDVNKQYVIDSEVSISKRIIERETGKPVVLFAFPNGNVNPYSEISLRTHGYSGGFVLGNRKCAEISNPYFVPRIYPNRKARKFEDQIRW